MHYNRVQNRHTQRERTIEAMKRWKKLQKMPSTIDAKGKVAQWALVKAFYATECYAVGQSWIQKCRTAITKSLIPNRKKSSPYLATLLLTKYRKDPGLFLILESILSTRDRLWNMTQQNQAVFCTHVAKHTRKHSDVYGPAGALAYNLARIGWTLNAQARVNTDSMVSFSLMQDDLSAIETFLEQTWMRHIMQTGITRAAWRNFPTPDRRATLKVFPKYLHEFHKRIGDE